MLAISLPADPLPAVPVLVDPLLAVPVPTAPVLVDPVVVPPGVVSVGLMLGPPEPGGLDVGGAGVEELLPGVGEDAGAAGLAVLDGLTVSVGQGALVALAVCLPPVALALAFAEAGVLAPPVAAEVALGVPVTVSVTVSVTVAVALALGLLLVPPLGGLLTGDALGATELADFAAADDGEPDAHAVTGTLLWTAEVRPAPAAPAGAFWVADPFRLGVS